MWKGKKSKTNIFFCLLAFLALGAMIASNTWIYNMIMDMKKSISCPDGWRNYKNQCYRSIFSECTRDQARLECNTANASLVSVHSVDENELVVKLLDSQDGWIDGLRTPGSVKNWVWADGSRWDFDKWDSADPEEDENCIMMRSDGGWEAVECDDTVPGFVCRAPVTQTVLPVILNITTGYFNAETIAGYSLYWVPGASLSVLGLTMLCSSTAGNKENNGTLKNLVRCAMLALVPLSGLNILAKCMTGAKEAKCHVCLKLKNIPFCPLHSIWFLGDNAERKKVYYHLANVYYGSFLRFCLNLYILWQTPSGHIPWLTWTSIAFSVYGLVNTPYLLLFFQDTDGEKEQPGYFGRIKSILSNFCGKKQDESNQTCGWVSVKILDLKNSVAHAFSSWDKLRRVCYKLVTIFFFLTNSLFNIMTMALFINFCGKNWGHYWVSVGYIFLLFMLHLAVTVVFYKLNKLTDWGSSVQMAWGNLFVLTVPLRQYSRLNVSLALKLQISHNFLHIGALCWAVSSRPEDFIFAPVFLIWTYFGFGLFSSFVLLLWQFSYISLVDQTPQGVLHKRKNSLEDTRL